MYDARVKREGVLVFAVLLLAGCGSGPAASGSPLPATTPALPSAAPTASASPGSRATPAGLSASGDAGPSSAAARGSVAPLAPAAAWPVYHGNPAHTGVGPAQPALTTVHQLWSTRVDGVVYAEPLVAAGRVFIVTENDTVYALDAGSGQIAWQRHVGEPVPRSSLPCGNVDPSGMTSTPALDVTSGVLYAVGRVQPAHHELFAFDVTNGALKFSRTIDPPGADPRYLQQRSGLVLANERLYVAYGGNFGDCGPYKGSVVAAPPDNAGGSLISWSVPTQREGGIWAPPGPTVDGNGDLLVAVGNAASTSQFDYGNAVIRLSPDLQVKDYWAPTDWADLSRSDRDIGSISPAILQDNQTFQSGKNGTGYLLRTSHLGNIGGEIFKAPVCNGAFSGTAYDPPMLYVPCSNGLVALKIAPGSFQVAWHAAVRAFSAAPVVAYGSIWQVNPNEPSLLQLDPATGKLRNRLSLPGPAVAHFLTPTAADGKVYVTSGKNVVAFGA